LPKITILIGFKFVELSTVDSTNNYATALIHGGQATHGTAIFAHEQTAGKGQRGKSWDSQKGSNIMLSVIVNTIPIQHLPPFLLSAATALACHQLFQSYAASETFIKWPNDIYWRDRKAGGILIENIYRGKEWQWAIIGMGININQTQFPEGKLRPVSLKQITGKSYIPTILAKELCAYLEQQWKALLNNHTEDILDSYESNLFRNGELVRLKKEDHILETNILGITTEGYLRTQVTKQDPEQLFTVGEVEWMFDH
jgi:BirA family biotin operon repressor/biotin-[acetyl-CoA-carboxylase] ligase